MKIDSNARYLESHEWARKEADVIVIGISDKAQEELSDVVYIELPKVGSTVSKGKTFGVIESVKAASDMYSPMSGEVVEVNGALDNSPETVNSDPYGAGWLIKIKPSNPAEWDSLLNAADYQKSAEAGH
jgi:glycine cleavage system H protein